MQIWLIAIFGCIVAPSVSFFIQHSQKASSFLRPIHKCLFLSPHADHQEYFLDILNREVLFDVTDKPTDIGSTILSYEEEKCARQLKEDMMNDKVIVLDETSRWSDNIPNEYKDNLAWSNPSKSLLNYIFYNKIGDIVDASNTFLDPFSASKTVKLAQSLAFTEELAQRLPDLSDFEDEEWIYNMMVLSMVASMKPTFCDEDELDLSITQLVSSSTIEAYNRDKSKRNNDRRPVRKSQLFMDCLAVLGAQLILQDDSASLVKFLKQRQLDKRQAQKQSSLLESASSDTVVRVGMVPGWVGEELIADLLLLHGLVTSGLCDQVTLFVNRISFGASSTPTAADVIAHIEYYSNPTSSDCWHVRHVFDALKGLLLRGAIELVPDDECQWLSRPLPLSEKSASADGGIGSGSTKEMQSPYIRDHWTSCDVVVVKGSQQCARLLEGGGQGQVERGGGKDEARAPAMEGADIETETDGSSSGSASSGSSEGEGEGPYKGCCLYYDTSDDSFPRSVRRRGIIKVIDRPT
jgi:hypothetical protein